MIVALLLACQATPEKDVPAETSMLALDGVQNLLVVQVDAFRYDHMSLYGYDRPTTPSMDGWWNMDGMVSATSWTAPSAASLLSGLEPQHHGVLVQKPGANSLNQLLESPTFAEHLRDQDFETYLATGNMWVTPSTGIGNGFDSYDLTAKQYPQGSLDSQAAVLDKFLVSRDTDRPFFAMLHTMDTHSPFYAIPEVAGTWASDVTFDETSGFPAQEQEIKQQMEDGTPGVLDGVRDVYDEQILGLDRQMARLQQTLETRGLTDNTVIVFTADHGELLGEYGKLGHNGSLEPELVHIPLAIYHPGLRAEKQRCLSENVDLMPTILTAMGIEVPDGLDGHPLQEGCREIARSSVFAPDGRIGFLQVEDETNRMYWACGDNRVHLEHPDGEEVGPERSQALYKALQDFDADLKAHVPGQETCVLPDSSTLQ